MEREREKGRAKDISRALFVSFLSSAAGVVPPSDIEAILLRTSPLRSVSALQSSYLFLSSLTCCLSLVAAAALPWKKRKQHGLYTWPS